MEEEEVGKACGLTGATDGYDPLCLNVHRDVRGVSFTVLSILNINSEK